VVGSGKGACPSQKKKDENNYDVANTCQTNSKYFELLSAYAHTHTHMHVDAGVLNT